MALKDVFKSIGDGLGIEAKEVRSLLRRIRLTADTSALGANFRRHGNSFGVYDFDAYVELAKDFYSEAMHSKDPHYTIVDMPDNRVGIDYDGEIRGIFKSKGKPLAFFRPDYHRAGFASKADEIEAFRKGRDSF